MLRLDCPRHHPMWSLQVLCVLKAVHFYLWHFWLVITSACSQKSTLRTLGLLVGHLTLWRAALVATASSVVAYYEGRRKGNRENNPITSQPTQAVKTGNGTNRWKQMDENAEVKNIMQMLLVEFSNIYLQKQIIEPFDRCWLGNNIL